MDIAAFDELSRVRGGPPRLLLDVRNAIEAGRWRPEGPGLTAYLNIPYFEFIEDEDETLARIPPGSEVLALCAKGGSSDYVAGLLRELGIKATNIEGGMVAWAAYHRIERVNAPSDPFVIYQVIRPAKGCLSYIVISGDEALVVDCSRYIDAYREFVEQHGAHIVSVLDTHLHADHVSGASSLSGQAGTPYFLSDDDAAGATIERDAVPLQVKIGRTPIDIVALPVPGHTLGSTALLIDKRYLISGDTLLPESVGRPDLGNKAREWTGYLYDSLAGILAKLDPNTAVLPAHASSAKQYDDCGTCVRRLGDLLTAQPLDDRNTFVERTAAIAAGATQPDEYAQIRLVNLGERATAERIEQLEIGVNQCALAPSGG